MATRRQMRIILPGTALAVSLMLAACGGSSDCKRACRKVQSCLANAEGDDAPDRAGAEITFGAGMDCSSIDTCNEQQACQASCMLAASCSDLLGGSTAVFSCMTQCASVKIQTDAGGSGLLKPVGSDSSPSCVPDCYGRQCGDDGCGGSCGSCGYGESCSYGNCVTSCVPDCYGKQCGDDGCGGSCGSCSYGESCSYGSCVSSSTGSSNSGQVCSQSQSCPYGEDCMQMDDTSTDGMCLGQCSTVGDLCAVNDSFTQLSVCALSAQSTSQSYCAWICENQGQTYACPTSYGYNCKVFDTSQPDIKLCMPK